MEFQTVDLAGMDRADGYKLFITAIVPRPIGWISTISADGVPMRPRSVGSTPSAAIR